MKNALVTPFPVTPSPPPRSCARHVLEEEEEEEEEEIRTKKVGDGVGRFTVCTVCVEMFLTRAIGEDSRAQHRRSLLSILSAYFKG
ncbi:hypothetical protein OJAV_G00076450 [Oryzias javanicus]|uniref:Uncharacterized protein n=1 Tax=Oryzias javanicus TaxID=123683 RepID=A0A437D2I0_ORYJA|nr:hypothetical protein OJAV_G00076450 [Oryzias javanicus]